MNYINNTTTKFAEFLTERQIFSVAFGLMIALQASQLTNTITISVINPVILKIFKINEIEDKKVNIFGVEILFGKLISGLLQFTVFLIFMFLVWLVFKRFERKIIK